jgi:beta-glucosidase
VCGDSQACDSIVDADGVQIGPQADSPWLYVYPPGIRALLKWVWLRYRTPVMVTENGMDRKGESSLSIADALEDQERVDYYREYLENVQAAVDADGVDLRGYFAWSLLDNFEVGKGGHREGGEAHLL